MKSKIFFWYKIKKGHRVYYHRIVVESESLEKESVLVKCGWMPHHPERHRSKRQGDQLSPDFQEDEYGLKHTTILR